MLRSLALTAAAVFAALTPTARLTARPPPPATTWPMFGGSPTRNMANLNDHGIPDIPDPGKGTNLLWTAALGSRTYTQPVVAGGRVYVGTNNEQPRNPRDTVKTVDGIEPADKGVLMCFDARTGKFLWQAVHDKLPSGMVNDWPKEGIASSPAVDGDRVYYVSNRAEVVCVDANGFADGNQGFQGEKYRDATDADVLWSVDMMTQFKVFPHNLACCCPLVVGDVVYVVTTNGVDEGHVNIPSPDAPSVLALDKRTGKLLWSDKSPGKNILHSQWSGPAYTADPVPQVIVPLGDGWLRAFDPATGILLWKFDGNPKGTRYELGGTGTRNDFIGYPVVHGGRVYIGTGQDPEHFSGIAHFWAVDLARAVENGRTNPGRDVSPRWNCFYPAAAVNRRSALAWHYGGPDLRPFAARDFVFGRTLSTACVVGDVLYAGETQGDLHCLDARTGRPYWVYDTKGTLWASPYYVDGKVYVATESGDLFVFKHASRPEAVGDIYLTPPAGPRDANVRRRGVQKAVESRCLLAKVEFDTPLRATPAAAGGMFYITTEKTLYAFGTKGQ